MSNNLINLKKNVSELEQIKSLFKDLNIIIEEQEPIFRIFGYKIRNNKLKIITYVDSKVEPQYLSLDISKILKIDSKSKNEINFILEGEKDIVINFLDRCVKKIILNLSVILFNYNKKKTINSL